jgi:hypothetical protein
MAQQCQSGRNDCLTRPQDQCGPGINDCLGRGQSDCKSLPPPPSLPGPNTAGIDKALQNPNLAPERREALLKQKSILEDARKSRASVATEVQYSKCLHNVVDQCRATHC